MSYLWDINNAYSTRSGKYKSKLETEFINNHLPKKQLKVLDIGGGSGRFAIPLAEGGNEVTVVEPNKEALTLLRQRNSAVICINKSFEEFDTNEKYDLILIIEVLGSFDNIDSILGRVYEMSNQNALLIISTKKTGAFKNKLIELRKKRTTYKGYTTLNNYRELLSKWSFYIENIKGLNWLPLKVNSNSIFVPLFIILIKVLRLNNWLGQSPELLICARKV